MPPSPAILSLVLKEKSLAGVSISRQARLPFCSFTFLLFYLLLVYLFTLLPFYSFTFLLFYLLLFYLFTLLPFYLFTFPPIVAPLLPLLFCRSEGRRWKSESSAAGFLIPVRFREPDRLVRSLLPAERTSRLC